MQKKSLTDLSNKKILITGAGGMLGTAFSEMLAEYAPESKVISLSKGDLDVTDKEAVLNCAKHDPDFIIHCAAKVNADLCEESPQLSHAIIVQGTANVVEFAQKSQAQLLYPQSFLIYDGDESPIDEATIPAPLNIYGTHKLEAEALILKELSNALVVRMAGFFGGREKDKNFVGKIIPHIAHLIRDHKESIEIGDRIWQPTYTNDLAYNCLVLLSEEKIGKYNMACHGQASFYDLTVQAVDVLGIGEQIQVIPVTSAQVTRNEKAKRPPLAFIENKRLKEEGLDYQRPWTDSLSEYLNHSYFKDLFS